MHSSVASAIPSILNAGPNGALALFVISLIISGVGTGAIKSNIAPLVAEQSEGASKLTIRVKNGVRYIEDPALTTSRIFMYFYCEDSFTFWL